MSEKITLTKAEIVEKLHEQTEGFSKKQMIKVVESIFDILKDNLESGKKIKLSRFGNFSVRDKKERLGRDPQTGKSITISKRRVLSFKPSQLLKQSINRTSR